MKYTVGIITLSDKGFLGERKDESGPLIREMLLDSGQFDVLEEVLLSDDREDLEEELIKMSDEKGYNLIFTTGGTGFAPRDITPEATLQVIERETRGIPETMRAESMKITNRGCLSRAVAGIRKGSIIINLPGSEKAALENLFAILPSLDHGLKMLQSIGSAECAQTAVDKPRIPSMDQWLREAKSSENASKIGMYLTHNGVVRATAKAKVRNNDETAQDVSGLELSYDQLKVDEAIKEAYQMEGIYFIKVWINSGKLNIGDDMMYVLVAGDIRPHVIDALQTLVGKIKTECVVEKELF